MTPNEIITFVNETVSNAVSNQLIVSKLKLIIGIIVIAVSVFAGNDAHIFNAINNSQIDKIYILSTEKQKEQDLQKATDLFPLKEITLFDYQTVSYDTEKEQIC